MEKCVMCGKGHIVKKMVKDEAFGIDLGTYSIDVCNKCGEAFYDEATFDKIEKKAKQMGVWGLKEKTTVHKAGGSFSIIIKKRLADFVGLKPKEEVYIYPEGRKKLMIELCG